MNLESFQNKNLIKAHNGPEDLQMGHKATYLSNLTVSYPKDKKNVSNLYSIFTTSFMSYLYHYEFLPIFFIEMEAECNKRSSQEFIAFLGKS